jgi:hypothetical protein
MTTVKEKKSLIKGKRILIDGEAYSFILEDNAAALNSLNHGLTYAVKCLIYKALRRGRPNLPREMMALGGKKSRALAAEKKAANKRKSSKKSSK